MQDKLTLLHREDYGEDADRIEQLFADTIDSYLNAIAEEVPLDGISPFSS